MNNNDGGIKLYELMLLEKNIASDCSSQGAHNVNVPGNSHGCKTEILFFH